MNIEFSATLELNHHELLALSKLLENVTLSEMKECKLTNKEIECLGKMAGSLEFNAQ